MLETTSVAPLLPRFAIAATSGAHDDAHRLDTAHFRVKNLVNLPYNYD